MQIATGLSRVDAENVCTWRYAAGVGRARDSPRRQERRMGTAAEAQSRTLAQVEKVLSSWSVEDVSVDVDKAGASYVVVGGATSSAVAEALNVMQQAGFVTMYERPTSFAIYTGAGR